MSENAFWRRNGFARLADLEQAELQRLRGECLNESARFNGQRALDWSRQWEYPFVLANLPPVADGCRVLDAGSGWRFFGPMLARRGYRVDACDLDASVGRKTRTLAEREGLQLEFRRENLERLSYGDASFDVIACVSVLEHTPNPERVVLEFARCLRPGGKLVLTFDVSLDGDRDISLAGAHGLVELTERHLELSAPFTDTGLFDADALRSEAAVMRTSWFRAREPGLLPWRRISRASLQSLARGRFGRPFFDLAVIGLVASKPG